MMYVQRSTFDFSKINLDFSENYLDRIYSQLIILNANQTTLILKKYCAKYENICPSLTKHRSVLQLTVYRVKLFFINIDTLISFVL